MKQQKHHVVPLSIGGRDYKSNWLYVSCADHKLIHSTLDIPYSTVRKYRACMNNQMFTPTEKQANAQSKIERMFFSRVEFIPKNILQKQILDKLREDTRAIYKESNFAYPTHKPASTLQGEVNAELKKRKRLYTHLCGGQPL